MFRLFRRAEIPRFPTTNACTSFNLSIKRRLTTGSTAIPINKSDGSGVSIAWNPRRPSIYHHIWLRDHCRCEACFQPTTKQRMFNTFELPPDIKPIDVQSTPEGLQVTWPDVAHSHVSLYPWDWLRENSYEPASPTRPSRKSLWGSEISNAPPTVPYEEVMAKDGSGLHQWLSKIDTFGFCFVSGVPAIPEATEEACKRIGFIRETHYGGFYDFTADLSRGDTAYSNVALGAHTDNTYFVGTLHVIWGYLAFTVAPSRPLQTDPCGIQLFHLLSHTKGSGGENLLVDGFHAALELKRLNPKAYDLLSTVPITAHAAGEQDIFYTATKPTLEHDLFTGALRSVRWNNDDRSVIKSVPAGRMIDWYDAIRSWNKILTSPESEYWVQLTPGTLVAINNHRVLHGRSAFTGKRRMSGAYIGIDEFRSRLTVLDEQFGTYGDLDSALKRRTYTKPRSVWNAGL